MVSLLEVFMALTKVTQPDTIRCCMTSSCICSTFQSEEHNRMKRDCIGRNGIAANRILQCLQDAAFAIQEVAMLSSVGQVVVALAGMRERLRRHGEPTSMAQNKEVLPRCQ